MGCGKSRPEVDYSAIAQALVEQEQKKRDSELSQQQNKSKFNIEPSDGFSRTSLARPDDIMEFEVKEKESAPRLRRQPSAVSIHGPPPSAPSASKQFSKRISGSSTGGADDSEKAIKPPPPTTNNGEGANNKKSAHHLRNVFAAPLQPEDVASFQPPKFPKKPSELGFLRKALQKNFVFTNLSDRQMKTILDAFERVEFEKDEEIVKQGDEADYFYVIFEGNVHYEVHGDEVGVAMPGSSFGELALLYTSPRSATVVTDTDCVLYRVDHPTFRYIMQTQREQAAQDKRDLLQGIPFLQDLDESDLNRLVDAMMPRRFQPGEFLARKGDEADTFYVVQEGKVRVTELDVGGAEYGVMEIGPGEFFGENVLMSDEPRAGNFVGKTKGIALSINKQQFDKTIGNFAKLVHKSQDKKKLSAIKLIQKSYLTGATLATLASQIEDQHYPPRTTVFEENVPTPAALYLVREGRVALQRKDGQFYKTVEAGGYFGDDMLMADLSGVKESADVVSKYEVVTLGFPTTLGVLTLEECRKVVDTTALGQGKRTDYTSIVDSDIQLKSLKKHAILGAGTFGQVWLVSKVAPDGTNRPYALKVQSKYELMKNKQAKGVVQERAIMTQLNHPFIIRLVQTYQDKTFIYMLLGLVQGGELFTLMHQGSNDGISEKDTKFYSACILEALSHMHRRQIVYRDLKPENVLIAYGGYPVLVDMGFAKFVPTKTYTLCGTPLYLAPEVILNQGHDKGADHWSWGILTYEMIAGYTPFYADGIDQITLFRFVVKGAFRFPGAGKMSQEVEDLIKKVLVGNPNKRLGSLAGGIEEIYAHGWFTGLDFAALRRKEIAAPWVPEIKDPLDTSKFDKWDHLKDKTTEEFPPISTRVNKIFESF